MRELALLAVLYATYSLTRLVADDSLAPARERAVALLDVEHVYGLAWERPLNDLFVDVDVLGLLGSYQYATAHYVVTAVVLVWLYRIGPSAYVPGRRALLAATVLALGLYLLLPMAPPRLVDGYVDVLALHAGGRVVGRRGLGPAGARRLHQPARRVPVVARRLGAVGRAGRAAACVAPDLAGARLDPRRRDRRGDRGHGEPLGDGRGRGLAGGRCGLGRSRPVSLSGPRLREFSGESHPRPR